MNRPLSSDHQLVEVKLATHSLPPSKRTRFLEDLAKRLGDTPTNQAVTEPSPLNFCRPLRVVSGFPA